MNFVTQVDITMPNVPGSMAKITDALRAAKVNIDAMYCTEGKALSTVHLLVNDLETAKLALHPLGEVDTTPAFTMKIKNEPGAVASVVRKCAGAGINIRNLVATAGGRDAMILVTVDDVERAKTVLR